MIEIQKPQTEAWFPEDVTESSYEELGKLLSLYTLWENYASYVYAKDSGILGKKKEELNIIQAQEMVKLNSDQALKREFSAKDDRQAYVTSLSHVAFLLREIAELEALVKMEKAVHDVFDTRYSCISRELTRRQSS